MENVYRLIQRFPLVLVFLFSSLSVFAQERTVSGTVKDEGGNTMPGVNVLVKGTSTGSSTDGDGTFRISVPGGDAILAFSFIGYSTQEIPVGTQSSMNVSMVPDAAQLTDVVVTALGISRETKTLVYGTQSVKPSQLLEVKDANNFLNNLSGKLANVVITQGSGGVGSGASIIMRGYRSIAQSSTALIVVDGVPINNATNGTAGSDFGSVHGSDGASNINPDDIESMTVLKGAAAAALYGSAAGNGVIVITTKKGKAGKLAVTINSGVTSDKVFAIPAVQNDYGQGNGGVNIDPTVGESWGPKMTGQSFTGHMGEQRSYSPQKDNIKDFFRNGLSLNNAIGIEGGTDKIQGYLSYTNNIVKGIIPKNDLNRHTINMRVSTQIGKFSIDGKGTYIQQEIKNRPRTGEENAPVSNIYQIPRNVSLDDAKNFESINNVGVPTPTFWPATQSSIYQNPYWIINRTAINEKRDRIIGNLTAKYKILEWLSIQGRASLDKMFDNGESLYSQGTVLYSPQGGFYSTQKNVTTRQWHDIMIEGKNTLSEDFKIDYRVGAIYQDVNFETVENVANGLVVTNKFNLNFASSRAYSTGGNQVQTQSVFAQLNLAYKEALFLEASFRNDWDSRLPSPYTIPYPSIGLSGIISDLVTLPDAISFLKVNANYAEVGNGGLANIRFNTFNYGAGARAGTISRSSTLAIQDLKFEIVKNIEVGIDAKFLNNKYGFNFSWYKSNSFNQLIAKPYAPATGYNQTYLNAGNIQNSGIELVVNATPVKQTKLNWDIALNLGMNRNKIVSLDPDTKIIYLAGGFGRAAGPVVEEGGRFGDMYAYRWKTNAQGQHIVSTNPATLGQPVWTDAPEYIGNNNPKATLGLTNTITYGPVSFRFLIDGRIGGIVVSGTEMNQAFNGIPEYTSSYREGGLNLGGVDESGSPVNEEINSQDFWTAASKGRYGAGEFFAYDATNFRLRELALSYNVPIPSSMFIKQVRLSAVARNVFFIYRGSSILDIPGIGTRKMTFDPEVMLGNGNYQGVQYYSMPSTRSLGFNVQLTF